VGDQQQGQAELAPQLLQQGEHLGLDHHVQGGGGLVGDQQPRRAGQGHGDHHPLALAARQLVGVAGRPAGGQADLLQQLAASTRPTTRPPARSSPSPLPTG
jgi:hypothetical protein